ncbi:MAG: DUF4838 domain-containing protein [Planctomycetes bacterium]|nr:DUF4838 domain-containing protein [Planctomycetota bacterium]
MKTTLHIASDDPTVRFAARELSRHLRMATGKALPATRDAAAATFRLGVCEDVGVARPRDVTADNDWVRIKPAGGGYVLTGSNPRSVLFAVYRYLHELGFRWLRPGVRGVVTPKVRGPIVRGLNVDEKASYKYRTICIEGACSEQHVLDLIDWQAKHAMNGYFIQFHYGSVFFKRWYDHKGSPYLKPEKLTPAMLAKTAEKIEESLRLRGMNFERMGHGWTCAAIGVSGEQGWDKEESTIVPADKVEWLAQVNGRKELWGGVAVNTNLNYGNPAVRDAVTDAIVDYAGKHTDVNLLHFWLADGSNNHDERPESLDGRPSDYFVDMLNSLDEKLSAAGLATRIVFLIYVDTLWAPTRTTIRNPDRFVLMFAPITRTYLRSFTDPDPTDEKPTPFVRNKLAMPKSAAVNLKYLRDWQEQYKGDGFDFDYHMIWACYYDPSMFTMGRTLHKDIQGLSKIGLHGLNSCQVQRMSFPTNLLMDVMARTLWNKKLTFQQIVDETFADAFGKDGGAVAEALDGMSKFWLPFFEATYIPDADRKRIEQGLRQLPRLAERVEELRGLVKRNMGRAHGAVKWSWRYLDAHVKLMDLLLPAMGSYLRADPGFRAMLDKALDYVWKSEKLLHPALDAYMIVGVLQWRANELEAWLKEHPSAAAL